MAGIQTSKSSESVRFRACVFGLRSATDSDAKRPPIPIQFGHRFRRKPATDSEAIRPPLNYKLVLILSMVLGVVSQVSADPPVVGLMGMNPVVEGSYAAVWVPVPTGQAISGVRWYNNDGAVVFPEILVAAGSPDAPIDLEDAAVVAEDVQGVSLGWSEVSFTQPFACEATGLYCLFVFPEGSVYSRQGVGGGAAIGYTSGPLGHQGWLCADVETWMRIEGENGLAIDPIYVPMQPGVALLSRPQFGVEPQVQKATMRSAYPNPFNPQTVLEYTLPTAEVVNVSIYDIAGRLVKCLDKGHRAAGIHTLIWQGEDRKGQQMPSGMYLARFEAGQVRQTQRLTLLK